MSVLHWYSRRTNTEVKGRSNRISDAVVPVAIRAMERAFFWKYTLGRTSLKKRSRKGEYHHPNDEACEGGGGEVEGAVHHVLGDITRAVLAKLLPRVRCRGSSRGYKNIEYLLVAV